MHIVPGLSACARSLIVSALLLTLTALAAPAWAARHALVIGNNAYPGNELRSAVIWTKALSTFTPDYSVEYLPTNPWIHQPFEGYDAMRPEQLIQKWSV